ncbi:MAG: hypothetical protein PSV13_00090, partial [Lacunisphaera sp.]|nr:hypothetical protein [Lacunisphaera sp.]
LTVTLAGAKVYDGTSTSTGASASISSGSLAAGDSISYAFAAIASPVAGSYPGLTTATITNASAPTARSSSYAITYAGSYSVTARPITVTLAGSKDYDGTTASTGASAAISAGTLAGTDSIGFAFAASPSVVAGSYSGLTTATISNTAAPTGRTASYVITYAGNYTISPRPITITLSGSKAYNGNTTAIGASASITTGTLAATDTIGYGFGATSSANVGTYTGLTSATISNPVAPTARTTSYAITHGGYFAITPGTQQPLTLNAVTSQDFNTSQTLTTTEGSGAGAVSFAIVGQSAAGVATLAGNSLTANTGTGWVDLQATKAAELNYQAITSSTVRVNFARINQAELTVTATPAAIFYGETSALASSGGSGAGAVIYSSATGGSISGSTFTAIAGTGMVLVTSTKAADADYNVASGTTNIILAKRSITVTLAGSRTADGNTTPTGAAASITTGSLAAMDTIAYAYAATSSPTAGFYVGLTTATVKNSNNVDVSAHYDITYAGTYTIWPAPTVASGLRAWYRPDFGITKDGTGGVSQWKDASGHGFHLTQTDPLKQPFWAGNALNGQPLIDFAGGERLKSAAIDLLDSPAAGQDLTVLILFQPSATQLAGAVVLDHDAQTEQGFAFQQDGSATDKFMLRWRNQAQTSWQGEGSPSIYATGQPHLITFIKSGTTQTAYVNGETAGSTTVEQNMHKAVAAFAVGGSAANAADYFGGRIAEVMIFNRALSPAERSSVEFEFGTRYGLANVGAEPDGLPDAWELQYFGHLGYGPDDDPDGDGLTNMQEYLLGRHPLKGEVPDSTGAVNLRVYSPNR